MATNTVWSGPDYCSAPGANRLAERIEAYWRERGFEILLSIRYDHGVAAVRSNMVNGSPGPQHKMLPQQLEK